MREGKVRSRGRDEILKTEDRCIYCANVPNSLEHMPPKCMFQKDRVSGMEYATCSACNNKTSGADAVAALLACMHPDNTPESALAKKLQQLIRMTDINAPGVIEELQQPTKAKAQWQWRQNSRILKKTVSITVDGPKANAYLDIFGAKMAMALYREHVGTALPLSGAVWCQHILNAGMTQSDLDNLTKIMPLFSTLTQGKKSNLEQFRYRYNYDGSTAVAAIAQFHSSLWFVLIATSDDKIIDLFQRPEIAALPGSTFVRPGGLLALLPSCRPLNVSPAKDNGFVQR